MSLYNLGEEQRTKNLAYYNNLIKQSDTHFEKMDKELPPSINNLSDVLQMSGVSRRNFLKWSSIMTGLLMLPPVFDKRVAKAAEMCSRLPVVWLNLAECTGCTESLLRSAYPDIDDLILETLSLEYHETLLVASGHQAEMCLEEALEQFAGKFVCVIEGAIPLGIDGRYLTIGSKGKTGKTIAREVTSKAAMTICIGSCSSFGNIPAANPNPTKAKGISDALGIYTVNIAGCPPNPANFVGTILHYLLFGSIPALDNLGRPVWAYGKRIHDFCERRPHYDAGEFIEEWGDEYAKRGWCLYKLGCKGPYTYGNCSKIRFNQGTSWPIMAGHGCIGCTEPDFWDKMSPLEKPIQEAILPFGGIEVTADKVGLALTGALVGGIGAHAVCSRLRGTGQKKSE